MPTHHAFRKVCFEEAHKFCLTKTRFLVVDPSPFMRRVIIRVLNVFGCREYREAGDGAGALEILKEWHPDIILTEYFMTPGDGIDLTSFIRTSDDRTYRMTPIIMVTAWTERCIVSRARDAGITEFVMKPFSAKTMMTHILETLHHPRPFILSGGYTGPDRRRRQLSEHPLRRKEETKPDRKASHRDITQEDIDQLVAGAPLVSSRGGGADPRITLN